MCGLVGVMKHNMGLGYIQRFSDLMTVAQLRGDDGAGIIAVPKVSYGHEVKHVHTKKTTWSSGHLVTLQDFSEVTKGDKSALIGHARQPTKGGSTLDNVHPHRAKDIILVHNGTMSHVGGVAVPQGKSDSKMIVECIANKGIQHFVQESFGAYALVWVDLGKQTLNFLRNEERPLWFCQEQFTQMEGSSVEALFWASESNMLHFILSRYAGYNKERHKFYPLPKNEHWEFPLSVEHTIKVPTKTERKKVYAQSDKTFGYGYYDGWETWMEDADQTPTPPFNHRSSNSGSAIIKEAAVKKETTQGMFCYTPPEHRQETGSSGRLSVSMLLHDSKTVAMANAARNDHALIHGKGESQKALTFQPDEKVPTDKWKEPGLSAIQRGERLGAIACTDGKRIRELVANKPCIYCETKPLWRGNKPPTIYPVRFTETRGEYVCAECVQDVDVQRLLGVA